MAQYATLNARKAFNAQSTDDFPIILVRFTGPELEEPVLLSTDPTEILSVEPLQYGTTALGEVYFFILMGVLLPDDKEASPPAAQVVLDNVERDMVKIVREAGPNVAVEFLVVMASDFNFVEQRYTHFRLVNADYDAATITLAISQKPILDEPYPAWRKTPAQFRGLFP